MKTTIREELNKKDYTHIIWLDACTDGLFASQDIINGELCNYDASEYAEEYNAPNKDMIIIPAKETADDAGNLILWAWIDTSQL